MCRWIGAEVKAENNGIFHWQSCISSADIEAERMKRRRHALIEDCHPFRSALCVMDRLRHDRLHTVHPELPTEMRKTRDEIGVGQVGWSDLRELWKAV